MIAYQPGDIVTTLSRFHPCGRVVWADDTHCRVVFAGETYQIPPDDLVVISIRNNPNLRLVADKINAASEQLPPFPQALHYELSMFAWQGTITARAFADYITKVPLPVVVVALEQLLAAHMPVPRAIEQVLNMGFEFLAR